MSYRFNRAKRLALLDRLSPPLLFAIAEACDQTIAFLAEDGRSTIRYREAKLWTTRESAETRVAKCAADGEASMRACLTQPERWDGEHEFCRSELAKKPEERRGTPWIEEVRGEASWRAQKDTW